MNIYNFYYQYKFVKVKDRLFFKKEGYYIKNIKIMLNLLYIFYIKFYPPPMKIRRGWWDKNLEE